MSFDVDAFVAKMKALGATDAAARRLGTHPYFAPSDEPLSWQTKGKCVRLDDAIYALHVMCARIAFRSLTSTIRQKIVAIGQSLENWVAFKVASRFLGPIANRFLTMVSVWQTQFREEAAQQEVEKAIRRQSLNVQRDIFKNHIMGSGKAKKRTGKRRTKTVWSRHFTPYKRIKPRKK